MNLLYPASKVSFCIISIAICALATTTTASGKKKNNLDHTGQRIVITPESERFGRGRGLGTGRRSLSKPWAKPTPAPPGPTTGPIPVEQGKPYEITGTTANDLLSQVSRRSVETPRRVAQTTSPQKFGLVYGFPPGTSKWVATNVVVLPGSSIEQQFPVWKDYPNAQGCLQRQWDRYIQGLRTHEAKHAKWYRQVRKRLAMLARQIPPQLTRDDLNRAFEQVIAKVQAEIDAGDFGIDVLDDLENMPTPFVACTGS